MGSKTESVRSLFWLRFGIYVIALPLITVPIVGLRKGTPLFILFVVVLALSFIFGVSSPSRRSWVSRTLTNNRWVRTIDLVVWNLVLAIFLLESLLVTVSWTTGHPLVSRPDERAEERINSLRAASNLREKLIFTNSRGYNDTDWTEPKPEGVFRVLALGDSFAFGVVGYEDNFLTRLEADLTKRTGRTVEVLNHGILGACPEDYQYLLVEEGIAFNPDLILVCFYVGNDFKDNSRMRSRLHAGSWYLNAFVTRLFKVLRERKRQATNESRFVGLHVNPLSRDVFDSIVDRHGTLLFKDSPNELKQRQAETLATLDRTVEIALPIPTVLAVLPTELQVSRKLQKEYLKRSGVKETTLQLSRPFDVLKNHFGKNGPPVLDFLPALIEAEAGGSTYNKLETHWNVRGNHVVAEALADFLTPMIPR